MDGLTVDDLTLLIGKITIENYFLQKQLVASRTTPTQMLTAEEFDDIMSKATPTSAPLEPTHEVPCGDGG